MTKHISIPLTDSYKLFNHGPVSIVTSAHGNQRNIMAASWTMPVDFSPAKVAVVIDKNTYTRELVDASGEFALQFPMRKIAKLTLDVGDISGRDADKFARYAIKTFPS
ncbi:MAG TPA: flavin reductase family protein, partial [Cellvibrio sp.]